MHTRAATSSRRKTASAPRCAFSPSHANATLNLGSTRQTLNHVDEAEGLFRRALALGVDESRANSNLALALMEQARPAEEPKSSAATPWPGHPDYPEARANLALALLMMGRLDEAWPEYEARWGVEPTTRPGPVACRSRGWTGQKRER